MPSRRPSAASPASTSSSTPKAASCAGTPSSERLAARLRLAGAAGLLAGLAACGTAPALSGVQGSNACATAGRPLGGGSLDAADDLWRSSRAGPLFGATIAPYGDGTCTVGRIEGSEGKAVAIDFSAPVGNRLHVERDERLEASVAEATFAVPLAGDPLALLQRAEHASYGVDGCGIDWAHPEQRRDGDAAEAVYRGTSCNCQARVRRDGAGVVRSLVLKSTC
jgi:hypothetical protein